MKKILFALAFCASMVMVGCTSKTNTETIDSTNDSISESVVDTVADTTTIDTAMLEM